MNYNADRRCSECKKKETGCTTWDNKEEKTVSGWDKNRFATSCKEFEGKVK
jgi:hypothetical protein